MSTAGQDGVGPVGGTNGAVTWLTGFVDYEIDISGITRRNSFMNSKRQIVTQAASYETLAKVVAVGVHDKVVYIDILKELNYPADILWRGGEAGVGVFVTDFAFVTAYTSQYGTSNAILSARTRSTTLTACRRLRPSSGGKTCCCWRARRRAGSTVRCTPTLKPFSAASSTRPTTTSCGRSTRLAIRRGRITSPPVRRSQPG